MATRQGNTVLQHLRRAILLDGGAGLTDSQLLGCFIDQRDDAAFAALVRRHGPMVLSVCRRVVGNVHDADDAFQATFLVLIRKASAVKPREQVANWLYGVAYHTARKARALAARRQAREKQVMAMPEPETVVRSNVYLDLQILLDQELSRLPDKYRVPIVLCDLEGKSRKEAARQLGWLDGTLSGRLARARQLLAKRLTRRGFAVSAGMVAVVLSRTAAPASVPASLLMSTVKAASLFAAGQAAGVVSTHVATLAEGVLKTMLLMKLKVVMVLLVVVAALSGATGLIYQTQAAEQPKARRTRKADAEKQAVAKKDEKPRPDKEQLQGTWKIVSMVDKDGVEEVGNWTIKDTTLRIKSQPKDLKTGTATEFFRFKLDETTKPKLIDLVAWDKEFDDADERKEGIYSIAGDTLKIRLSRKKGQRPTAFESKEGSAYLLWTLQRERPKDEEKKDAKKNDNRFPDGRDHHFGKVKQGTSLQHTFRIVNTSDSPLHLTAVRVSCGCMTGSVSKKVLQPNEEGKVEIAVDTRRFVGSKNTSLFLEMEQRGTTETFRFSTTANSVERQ